MSQWSRASSLLLLSNLSDDAVDRDGNGRGNYHAGDSYAVAEFLGLWQEEAFGLRSCEDSGGTRRRICRPTARHVVVVKIGIECRIGFGGSPLHKGVILAVTVIHDCCL